MAKQGDTTAVRGALEATGAPKAGVTLQQRVLHSEFQELLGRNVAPSTGVTAQRMTGIVLNELQKNPDLAACSAMSFLGAVMAATQLGLEFGPLGLAYLVPFNNNYKDRDGNWQKRKEAQLIVGYKGIIQLARRSPELRDIVSVTVFEGDTFDYWRDENGDRMEHRPARYRDRGDPVAYYAHATFTTGGKLIHRMDADEIEDRAKRFAQSYDHSRSPWNMSPESRQSMFLKTPIRAIQPFLPLTTRDASALAADERIVRLHGNELRYSDVETDMGPPPDAPPHIDVASTQVPPAKSEQRVADEEALVAVLADMPGPASKACSGYLIQRFGPLADVADDQMGDVLAVAAGWPETQTPLGNPPGDPQGAPEAESGPSGDDTDPGWQPPEEGAAGAVDDATLKRIEAVVNSLSDSALKSMAQSVGVTTRNVGIPALKMKVRQAMAEGIARGDASIEALL